MQQIGDNERFRLLSYRSDGRIIDFLVEHLVNLDTIVITL